MTPPITADHVAVRHRIRRGLLIERHVDLYLVRVRWPVRTVLARSGFRAQLGEDHLWHGLSQAVRVARQQHGIERPEHAEPEPVVVEGADEVQEAKEEVIASPTLDDATENEASRRPR